MRSVFTLFITVLSFAVNAQFTCGFDQLHTTQMANDPVYRQKVEQMNQAWIQERIAAQSSKTIYSGAGTVYEIPVVIHVIHDGGAVGTIHNPSDAQLLGMLDYLNETYAATYASYPDTNSGGTKIPFQFVLAQRDPNCSATTGIIRVDGSGLSGYSTYGVKRSGANGPSDASVKALSIWPNGDYYNIWVVNRIDGEDGTSIGVPFVAGYAYFPGASASVDGTVMLATQATAGSITLPHEIGHAFGVYHTFEGGTASVCPTNTNCLTQGDLVCDTEPQKQSNFNCPTDPNPCTGLSYNNVQYNFMDYSNCQTRFTPGQRDRMISVLLSSRAGLASSLGGEAPGTVPTAANCTPTINAANASNNFGMGPVKVVLNNMSATSSGYNGDDYQVYLDRTCKQTAYITAGQSYTVYVSTSTNVQKVIVLLDYDNDGLFESINGEVLGSHSGSSATEVHSINFTVPGSPSVTCAPIRMRVLADFVGSTMPADDGCSQLDYGQGEDYSVIIRPAAANVTLATAVTGGSNPSCGGTSITFTATPSASLTSPVYTWYVNGGTVGTNSTTYSSSTLANNDIVTCRVVYSGTCSSDDSAFAPAIKVIRSATWTGASGTDWNTAGNWSCGAVPTASTTAIVPNVANAPIVGASTFSVGNFSLASGETLSLSSGAVLNVSGSFANDGTITGSGKVVLNGSDLQEISGSGSVENLELNNTEAGASIVTGNTMNVTGTLTLTDGLLTTNSGLTLKSTSAVTARIATITNGQLGGNVTVEKYIPGRRAYRFMGHPFTTSIALNQLTGTGEIDITGAGGSTNGFTNTGTNNPSAFWYDPTTGNGSPTNDPGWTAFTSATASDWDRYEGLLVMVRGAKGEGLTGNSYTPSATTINMTGVLNTGSQLVTLTNGTNSGYNLISNPFPSQIDLNATSRGGNINSNFWVWNTNAGVRGAYVTLPFSSSYILPAYASFFAQTTSASGNTIQFDEADKSAAAATTSGGLFKTTATAGTLQLNIESDTLFWDQLLFSFDDQAMAIKEPLLDGGKLSNPDVDLYSLSADDQKLAVDVRPMINAQLIKLGLRSGIIDSFKINVAAMNLPVNAKIYLRDKYLNQSLELQQGSSYSFRVTTDSLSQGENRFELTTIVTPVDIANTAVAGTKMKVYPNPANEQVTVSFESTSANNTSLQLVNMIGQQVYHQDLGNRAYGTLHIAVGELPAGVYMLKLYSGKDLQTERIIIEHK